METGADLVKMTPRYEELKEEVPPMPVTEPGLSIALVRDHLPWSLLNLSHMNCCCLGLVATIYSVKSRDKKAVGDVEAARHFGSTARSFNIAATVLSILFFIAVIAMIIAGTFQM